MPMTSSQLAALVERAKQKAPPAVSPPLPPPAARPPRPVRLAQARPEPPAPPPARRPAAPDPAPAAGTRPIEVPPPPVPSPTPAPEPVAEPEDFPEGWALTKESWHFHRRFYRVFRRPMAHGEYSHLLWQIRHRKAEHLCEDCWRVTLPDGRRTLAVRATRWQLLTILPKGWEPPQSAAASEAAEL